jgi:hypothetical protein
MAVRLPSGSVADVNRLTLQRQSGSANSAAVTATSGSRIVPAVRPVRRLSDLGLSCLRNEVYDVKRALNAGQQPCNNKLEKWQWVAGFGMGSCHFKMHLWDVESVVEMVYGPTAAPPERQSAGPLPYQSICMRPKSNGNDGYVR